MKKGKILKKIVSIVCAVVMLMGLAACGEKRVNLSKNMLVANQSDVTVNSINLDVVDGSLESPIKLLDSPLTPGEARAITFSVPEKQAKSGEWKVWCETVDGESSNPFEFGEFNPHGEGSDISCFGVSWNEDRGSYIVTIYNSGSEANEGIYEPCEELADTGTADSDSEYTSTAADRDSEDFDWDIAMLEDNKDINFLNEDKSLLLHFFEGNIVFVDDKGIGSYEYDINEKTIIIEKDEDNALDPPVQLLTVLDLCTLEDEQGNTYRIEDSEGEELVMNWPYYRDADGETEGISLRADGSVEVGNDDGDRETGIYKVEDNVLTLNFDGYDPVEFKIYNKRILIQDDDTVFFRLYP